MGSLEESLKNLFGAILALGALLILIYLYRMTGELNTEVRESAKDGSVTRVNREIDWQTTTDSEYGYETEQIVAQVLDFYGQNPSGTVRIQGSVVNKNSNANQIRMRINKNYQYSREYVFDESGNISGVNYTAIR